MTSPHEVSKDVIIVGSGAGKTQLLLDILDREYPEIKPHVVTHRSPLVVLRPDDMSGSMTAEEAEEVVRKMAGYQPPGGHYDYEDQIQGTQMFIKMRHDMPVKCVDYDPPHKPGETPRGTKPSWVGGMKKTKQQRAAIKARRKQR